MAIFRCLRHYPVNFVATPSYRRGIIRQGRNVIKIPLLREGVRRRRGVVYPKTPRRGLGSSAQVRREAHHGRGRLTVTGMSRKCHG
jgi:hypothetical protein